MFLFSTFVFLGSIPLISSHPQWFSTPTPIPASSLTAAALNDIQLVEQYAAASYCPGNTIQAKEGSRLKCNKSNNCARVEGAAATIMNPIRNAAETDVRGFVAADTSNKLTVIAFQGTQSKRQFQADLNFNLVNITHVCKNCTVHSGFWRSWQEAKPAVMQALSSAWWNYPSHKIIATGHSLGGAIATLAATDLRSMGFTVDLYTFGAPRIGNQKTADHLGTPNYKLGKNFRVTHYNDPIPQLPPELFGYAHFKPEIYISSANQKSVILSDLQMLDTAALLAKGNTQWVILDISAHQWYFNSIAACHSDNPIATIAGNGTTKDLAASWAGTIIGLMGNNTNLILVGSKTTDTLTASALAGLLASMSTSAARTILEWIPGTSSILSSLPTAGSAAAWTSAGIASLITVLESSFPSKRKMKKKWIVVAPE